MERAARNRNQLPTNLPQLQNLIKRDSLAYKDEVGLRLVLDTVDKSKINNTHSCGKHYTVYFSCV